MEKVSVLNALGANIRYLSHAQSVVSQNIANADTPGYRAQTLTPVDFSAMVGAAGSAHVRAVNVKTTQDRHITSSGTRGASPAKEGEQKVTYEVAPAGNAVILEEQMVSASNIRMQYDLMLNLYTKNMAMMRTALGAQR
jgi:flagellar basal-body rod protein FlgB